MNWAAIGNMGLLGGWLYAAYFALCLPRKVELSVVTVFSDID